MLLTNVCIKSKERLFKRQLYWKYRNKKRPGMVNLKFSCRGSIVASHLSVPQAEKKLSTAERGLSVSDMQINDNNDNIKLKEQTM